MELDRLFDKYQLTTEQYQAFKERFKFHQVRAGDVFFEEGDPAETFYFVKSGELTVSRMSSDRQERVLKVLGPGELFGEIGLLNHVPRTATIKALTDAQLFELGKEDFFELLESNASFASFLEEIKTLRLMREVPMFRKLDENALLKIRRELTVQEFEAGDMLANEDDPDEALYLVAEGNARTYSTDATGHEETTGFLRLGSHVGDRGLLERRTHKHTIVFEDSATVMVLPKKKFRALLRRNADISYNLPESGWINTILPFFYDRQAFMAIPALSMNRPRKINRTMGLVTLVLVLMAALPSLFPAQFPFLKGLVVDTDPENMLSEDEAVRVYHNKMKSEMTLYDIMVVGVVNETHPNGVFNAESLKRVHELTEYAGTLQWPDEKNPGGMRGVLAVDMLAPSTMDVVEQAGEGAVKFSWLMPSPPETDAEAMDIYRLIKRYPTMDGMLISDDGKAVSLYLPLTSKDISYRVYQSLNKFIAKQHGDERYLITGLPVAEDQFGVEMFIQMAVCAPAAMVVIFLLMYFFFRNLTLVVSPMLVAMVAVMCTMALLIISGNTVHIMSSMIAIFIMPIAVLDSVHILSEFVDYYPRLKDRRLTMEHVMRELFMPMFYTSLTTAIGFVSLALVPIPPVQVFGVFVAIGVGLAWLLSISFIPAYVMLMPQKKLDSLISAGANRAATDTGSRNDPLSRVHGFTVKYSRVVLAMSMVVVFLCLVGVQRIIVNDNPVRWFAEGHPIRIADEVLNEHFAGTYMAFLALEAREPSDAPQLTLARVQDEVDRIADDDRAYRIHTEFFAARGREIVGSGIDAGAVLQKLEALAEDQMDTGPAKSLDFWEQALDVIQAAQQERQYFKDPAVLNYISDLQKALAETGIVGKSISVADFSKTIYRELRGGTVEDYRLPNTAQGVAQTYITYQSGHRPQDLWRYVTPDYRKASIWLMLNSGDNVDMANVVKAAESYMHGNPPPADLKPGWFGLTYINVVWQDKMVTGMMKSIASGYLAVLLLMVFLLRSTLWGILAMVPLTCSMLIIYGVLGLTGKPYDMPVAVLSSLSIGLAVDFTIHFLVRLRHFVSQTGSWQRSLRKMFTEPARAIVRNMLVVAIGFLPLLLAPLVPYNTVGTLIAVILFTSGIVTLMILSAILKTWSAVFFPMRYARRTTIFRNRDTIFVAIIGAAFFTVTYLSFFDWRMNAILWIALATCIPVYFGIRSANDTDTEFDPAQTVADPEDRI